MRLATLILVALAVVLGVKPAWSGEPPLEERAASIERSSKAPDGERVVVGHISRKLGISVETLRSQRTRAGLSWGEVLIANLLSKAAGLTFDQVVTEFQSGKGLEDVARDHKLDLGKLASEVQRSQEVVEQRAEDRRPRGDMGTQPDPPTPAARRPGFGAGPGSGHGH